VRGNPRREGGESRHSRTGAAETVVRYDG
jgi:hypothetical protein